MDYRRENDWILIALPPNFTHVEARSIGEFFKTLRGRGEIKFLFDAAHLVYIDSFAIGLLLELFKDVKKIGGDVHIRDLQGEPKNIFRKTGLEHVFDLEESQVAHGKQELAFNYDLQVLEKAAVFRLSGMIYYPQDGGQFKETLMGILEEKGKVVLDLTDLKYLDSRSINMLISLQNEILKKGKEIRFCNRNELIKDIFDHSGMENSIKEFASVDEALAEWK